MKVELTYQDIGRGYKHALCLAKCASSLGKYIRALCIVHQVQKDVHCACNILHLTQGQQLQYLGERQPYRTAMLSCMDEPFPSNHPNNDVVIHRHNDVLYVIIHQSNDVLREVIHQRNGVPCEVIHQCNNVVCVVMYTSRRAQCIP